MEKIIKDKRIVVGMSGGVDSSMALLLLKKQGWQPVGVSLKYPVWKSKKNPLKENVCCSAKSFAVAEKICDQLGVPYYIFDVSKEFDQKVVKYFVSEFKNKRTPNPCVVCNRRLKFQKLFEWAEKHKIKYVSTGHYARLREAGARYGAAEARFALRRGKPAFAGGKYQLLKAKDKTKDQTYSLCWLPQEWLGRIVFPLGNYLKEDIYKMSAGQGFEFFLKKKESQDFCFVPGKSLPDFLEEKLGNQPGPIIDARGRVLGRHPGLHFYTIGQRKGINLPDGPYFVKGFDRKKNALVVTKDEKDISKKEIFLSSCNFISIEALKKPLKVMARVRYGQPLSPAVIHLLGKKGKCRIVFQKAQRAATPGQFCVFYRQEACLGGGIIE